MFNMPSPSERVMRQHIAIWRFLGLWPLVTDSFWYKTYSIYIRMQCFVVCPLVIVLAIPRAETINDITDVMIAGSASVLATFKVLCFVQNRHRVLKLFGTMQMLETNHVLCGTVDGFREQRFLNTAVRNAKRLLYGLTTCSSVCVVLGLMRALFILDGRVLLWPAVFPWNWHDSNIVYLPTVMLQFLMSMLLVATISTVDIYGPAMYILLSAYLDVLGLRMGKLGHSKEYRGDTSQFATERGLAKCIKYYALLLKFSECLNDVFAVHYTVQFSTSALYIVSIIFQLITRHDMSSVTYLLPAIAVGAMQVFLPCYFGSIVMERSEQLPKQLYASNWMDQSKAFKVTLRIVLERSKQPISLQTYKGMFLISLPTFVLLMRGTYSLLSCISSF